VPPDAGLVVVRATAEELREHERMVELIARASGNRCLYREDATSARTTAAV
jgi:hypothetical protein